MRFVRGPRDPPASLDEEALREAVAREEVSLAFLFGSYASGTAGPLSDLDVAVSFADGVSPDRRRRLTTELLAAIQEATGMDAIDLVDVEAVGPALGYEAVAKGTLLYGDRREAIALEARLLSRRLDFEPIAREWNDAITDRIREGSFGRP